MVTGDHPQTALAIARQIGLIRLPKPVILTGEELSRLSLTQLQLALDAQEILFARLAADQKMGIVDALKRKHEIVAVTGDGVNVADMILLDDNFASIVSAIEEGRAVFANIRKFLSTARQERTSLSAGHHRLLERHHRFASCQCAYLSVQLEFGV
jgi:sodium/potassium-transporting ATPase subunit alpha